jgi:hypothetical protein
MMAAKAMQQAERISTNGAMTWLTTFIPALSRDGALLDANPDMCRHITLTLVSRTTTQTLPHDQKFPINAEKMKE